MTRKTKIRLVAWLIIVAMAACQAYAQRYTVSPDGISYLDLSDAVVARSWSRIVNLYWSPLYPALIGFARLAFGAGAAKELPIAHAVGFVAFLATFWAFEYFLTSLLAIVERTPRVALRGPWGLAGAYALFGFMALTMTPLELTTPDLIASATVFVVFGALLRLHGNTSSGQRDAVMIGVALGVGALAKSFMVPWALVCFATLAIALRWRRASLTAIAVVVWAAIVLPWCAVLSRQSGRLTFGDSGRLTYAWFVNGQFPPALGGVPPGARTAETEAILPGVGVTGQAPGSDAMWFDPPRWNATLHPHWVLANQLDTVKALQLFYLEQFAPLVFLVFLVAVAPTGTRRRAWNQGWIVWVPAIIGLGAYSLVIVAARYIMPFLLAAVLLALATLPVARRFVPWLAFIGLAIPVGLESLDSKTAIGLGVVTAILGGVVVSVLVPVRRRAVWVVAVVLAAITSFAVLAPLGPRVSTLVGLALAVAFWFLARDATRRGNDTFFATRAEIALAILLSMILFVRFANRAQTDIKAEFHAASPEWGNVPTRIAQDLAERGLTQGTGIALIGPHAESYWVRSGRLHIAASVPRTLVDRFWALSPTAQDSLLSLFADAGATYAVASMHPAGQPSDPRWRAVGYNGWLRRLDPSTRLLSGHRVR